MNTLPSSPPDLTLAVRVNAIDIKLRAFVRDAVEIANGLGVHTDAQENSGTSLATSTISTVMTDCQASAEKLSNLVHRTADFVWRDDEPTSLDPLKTPPLLTSLHARSGKLADTLQGVIPVLEGIANRLGIFFSDKECAIASPMIPTSPSIDGDLLSVERSLCDIDRAMARCFNKVGCAATVESSFAPHVTRIG